MTLSPDTAQALAEAAGPVPLVCPYCHAPNAASAQVCSACRRSMFLLRPSAWGSPGTYHLGGLMRLIALVALFCMTLRPTPILSLGALTAFVVAMFLVHLGSALDSSIKQTPHRAWLAPSVQCVGTVCVIVAVGLTGALAFWVAATEAFFAIRGRGPVPNFTAVVLGLLLALCAGVGGAVAAGLAAGFALRQRL